jgi:probable rRNA maturation factor
VISAQTTESVTLTFTLTGVESTLAQVLADHNSSEEVTVVISDDEHLRHLNNDFRQMDRPTDVLSFELDDPNDPEDAVLGEIYISADRAREQADEAGHTLEAEIHHLAVHGVLHLLGYEHDTDPGYEKMKSMELRYQESYTTY